MKILKMQNKVIVPVFQFLQEATLKGAASRGRTKMLKRLEEKSKEYNDSLTEAQKEYFQVDETGELIKGNDGKFVLIEKDKEKQKAVEEEADKEIKRISEEEFEISFNEYATKYEALFTALETSEEELNGQKAFGYNELLEAYEAIEEEK